MTRRWRVPLSDGSGGGKTSALLDVAAGASGDLLVLGHGAGTSAEHATLEALALAFAERGFTTVRFDFPYRRPEINGTRKIRPPDRMPKLVSCFRDVTAFAHARIGPRRLFVGGHSMGSRAAAHLAAGDLPIDETEPSQGLPPIDGALLCAYPLHPPNKPDRLRDEVLVSLSEQGRASLWISGTRDAFCTEPIDLAIQKRLGSSFTHVRLKDVDHGYMIPKRSGQTRADVLAEVADHARTWADSTLPRHKA